MPRIEYLPGPVPFQVSADAARSFATIPRLARITAPGALVRFITHSDPAPRGPAGERSRYAGRFWFDANLLELVRRQALNELTQQRLAPSGPTTNTLRDLIGLYTRLYLRESLAICKNWKENFDATVTLELLPKQSLIALVGPIADQPYYSPDSPDYERAAAAKIRLQGGVTQYYIDFNHPANLPLAAKIIGPVDL